MSYDSHKERVCVSECFFFWYQLTWVILDKGPLNGLLWVVASLRMWVIWWFKIQWDQWVISLVCLSSIQCVGSIVWAVRGAS